jgi:phage gp36-like protein
MGYVTNADIEERIGTAVLVELTDDDQTGQVDADKVDEARLGAEGEVNGALGRRYAVPVDVGVHTELAGLLKSITLDVAEYRLYGRRPPVPADVKTKRDGALRWLESVAEGRAVLPAASVLPGPVTEGIIGAAVGAERVLKRNTMEDL